MPDYCLLVVGSNMGVQMMTREHISIACALNIPMFVAVTKIDICPPKYVRELARGHVSPTNFSSYTCTCTSICT